MPIVDDSLSQTRISCASRTALTQNASPFDAMHIRHLYGIATSSTTSRSTATKASSGAYMADKVDGRTRRRHKKRSRRRGKHGGSDSDGSGSNPSLDLASSHSSDDDDRSTVPQQRVQQNVRDNEINAAMEQANLPVSMEPRLGLGHYQHVMSAVPPMTIEPMYGMSSAMHTSNSDYIMPSASVNTAAEHVIPVSISEHDMNSGHEQHDHNNDREHDEQLAVTNSTVNTVGSHTDLSNQL